MTDESMLRVSRLTRVGSVRIATRTASCLAALLLTAPILATPAHADKGDCSQPLSTGAVPAASDCLFILKAAVGSATCDPPCICAPKGTLPVSASDALVCLRHAVGQPATLDCPCLVTTTTSTTTTTIGSGSPIKGAIPIAGRMNASSELGLPAATATCEDNFPGSHYCVYTELVAAQGANLAGLKDIHGATVTSFWAIDPDGSEMRQCGQSLSNGDPLWTYATGHLGVGGDSVPLTNGTGMLGALVIGGGSNRNCSASKWIACCQ